MESRVCPQGYKQTEVGMIPEEWDVQPIGAFAEVSSGGTPNREKKDYWNGTIPWITTTLINGNEINAAEQFISEKGLASSATNWFKKGTLLMAMYGQGKTRGKVSVLGIDATINQACAGILVKKSLKGEFLLHYLKSRYEEIRDLSNSGGQENLSGAIIKQIKVPVPLEYEQTAIANTLSDVDVLITSLEKLITKKRTIKTAAMQQLLTGRARLPGFSGEWELIKLGEVADPNQKWSFTGGPFGSNLKSSDYIDDGVRIIQLQNIGDGEFHNGSVVFTSPEKADELLSCNIYPGEIILSKMGDPVARACIIPQHHERYLMCSDGIRLAVNPKRFNTYFIYLSINAPDFRTRAENAGTGSTRKRIGLTELRNLELLCPELPEQIAIATILSDMNSDITALEAQLAKARLLNQGMMQELLTGRTRLI